MSNENKQHHAESNDERDQDEGNMNNGEIGGSMGIRGSSNEDGNEYEKKSHEGGPSTVPGDTGGGASDGSKSGSGLGDDGNMSNAGSKHRGSAAEQ
jgi:hypothetical protein